MHAHIRNKYTCTHTCIDSCRSGAAWGCCRTDAPSYPPPHPTMLPPSPNPTYFCPTRMEICARPSTHTQDCNRHPLQNDCGAKPHVGPQNQLEQLRVLTLWNPRTGRDTAPDSYWSQPQTGRDSYWSSPISGCKIVRNFGRDNYWSDPEPMGRILNVRCPQWPG